MATTPLDINGIKNTETYKAWPKAKQIEFDKLYLKDSYEITKNISKENNWAWLSGMGTATLFALGVTAVAVFAAPFVAGPMIAALVVGCVALAAIGVGVSILVGSYVSSKKEGYEIQEKHLPEKIFNVFDKRKEPVKKVEEDKDLEADFESSTQRKLELIKEKALAHIVENSGPILGFAAFCIAIPTMITAATILTGGILPFAIVGIVAATALTITAATLISDYFSKKKSHIHSALELERQNDPITKYDVPAKVKALNAAQNAKYEERKELITAEILAKKSWDKLKSYAITIGGVALAATTIAAIGACGFLTFLPVAPAFVLGIGTFFLGWSALAPMQYANDTEEVYQEEQRLAEAKLVKEVLNDHSLSSEGGYVLGGRPREEVIKPAS